jgi:hypothetical protein
LTPPRSSSTISSAATTRYRCLRMLTHADVC